MKKTLSAIIIATSVTVSAQVGLNTENPKSTMDVSAKRDAAGTLTDNAQLIGLQAPRVTREELTINTATYGTDQKGALIYVTDISGGDTAGQRANIDAAGYYYFDGTEWQRIGKNIYNSNGTLTDDRTVTLNGNDLEFLGAYQHTYISNINGILQEGLPTSPYNQASIQISAPDHDNNGIKSNMYLQAFSESSAQILAGEDAKGLIIGTHGTKDSAPVEISTSSGNGALGETRMTVTGEGNVGIGTNDPDTSALLDVSSTNKGFLPPRIALNSTTDVVTIPSPATGLFVYNTGAGTLTTKGYYYWDGAKWTRLSIADGGGDFQIGEERGYRFVVPGTFQNGTGNTNKNQMTGRAATQIGTISRKALSEFVNPSELPSFEGVRLDILGGDNSVLRPRFYNTNTSNVIIESWS